MKGRFDHKTYCWCKLSVAFALANAIGLLILGLLGAWCDYGLPVISVISSIYPGYAPTISGSFIGAFWGFWDILIFFVIAGAIYCGLSRLCSKCCSSECSSHGECSVKTDGVQSGKNRSDLNNA